MYTKIYFLIITLLALLITASCSVNEGLHSSLNNNNDQDRYLSKPDYDDPKEAAVTSQVVLAGVFQDQLRYFYAHYGRFPASFEEWKDSGFLIFTPWSGHPTKPAGHVDYSPDPYSDPYGTFHYESYGQDDCKLEFVFQIREQTKTLSFEYNEEKLKYNTFQSGYTYCEAKADSYSNLLDILWATNHRLGGPGSPSSIMELLEGYVSLVPEGFKPSDGLKDCGFFEFGMDMESGLPYYVSDLKKSQFSIFLTAESEISDNRLVFFSSEILTEGYPGLFD